MKKLHQIAILLASFSIASSPVNSVFAESEVQEFLVKIQNHSFEPSKISAKADKAIKLTIENLDNTIEEFESDDLKKEKLVGANKKVTISIAALKPGEYRFYGDFHQKTAQGSIVVK
jgi:plastocyanin